MAPYPPSEDHGADPALIRGLRSDDPEALQQVLDRYWDPLVAFARRMVGDGGDPEDQAQEALARLWAKRHVLREEGSLKALLYTIVRNICLDELRKKARRDQLDAKSFFPTRVRTPWEDVHGAELQRAAAVAVAHLPTRRREVFRLVREEGLSYQEAAGVLELSPQTVANHMSLALADLRTALKPFLPASDPRTVEGGEAPTGKDRRGRGTPLG
jgi:RNA polymerase sigma-70 factor (ECF subfamily)